METPEHAMMHVSQTVCAHVPLRVQFMVMYVRGVRSRSGNTRGDQVRSHRTGHCFECAVPGKTIAQLVSVPDAHTTKSQRLKDTLRERTY